MTGPEHYRKAEELAAKAGEYLGQGDGQMKRSEHHREAERLLSEARKEQDGVRRDLILAEAQVHANQAASGPYSRPQVT